MSQTDKAHDQARATHTAQETPGQRAKGHGTGEEFEAAVSRVAAATKQFIDAGLGANEAARTALILYAECHR